MENRNGLTFIIAGILIFAFVILGVASCNRVGPGYVGIVVSMAGDNRGVADIPVETGWVFVTPITQKVLEYPTFVQTVVLTRTLTEGNELNEEISYSSKEGMSITADISFSYSLQANKAPNFYVKFRHDDLTLFTHGFLKNVIRDKFTELAGKFSVEQNIGDKKDSILLAVRAAVQKEVIGVGITIEQFGFVGNPRPPQSVVDALNMKVNATQIAIQTENELRTAQAQAAKVVAEADGEAQAKVTRAKGEAESNRILTSSITPALMEWKRLGIQEKWDGAQPLVVGSTSQMILDFNALRQAKVAQQESKK
jgi:regulator of protease activity HflC (stomatin/prohibitin superfamily)